MLSILFELLLWGVLGAIPGFYAYYVRQHDTRLGIAIGAIIGAVIGVGGTQLGFIASPLSAAVIIIGLLGVMMLLMPEAEFDPKSTKPKNNTDDNQRKVTAAIGGILIVLFLLVGIERAFFGYSVWIAVAIIVGGMLYAAYLGRDTDTTVAQLQSTTVMMLMAIGVIALIFAIAIPTIGWNGCICAIP
jgi:MFS family permease